MGLEGGPGLNLTLGHHQYKAERGKSNSQTFGYTKQRLKVKELGFVVTLIKVQGQPILLK